MSARNYNISETEKHTGQYGSNESQSFLSPCDHSEPDIKPNMVNSVYYSIRGFCVTSKATILILLWTVFVGVLHHGINVSLLLLINSMTPLQNIGISSVAAIFYASSAVVYMFYPLNGYIADVCCGRFKTIVASLVLLLVFLVCCLVSAILYSTFYLVLSGAIEIIFVTVCVFSLFLAIIGIAGYSANFIQFGLDQLLDAPSHHLALFVHWANWCYDLMAASYVLVYVYLICDTNIFLLASISVTAIFPGVSLILLLIFGCWKRHWFHFEPGQCNPYATVFKVLNFARKHKYPRQRSAFTYCDNERPSRLDIGKERYGGPFTTEQVEDVKAFLRIVAILSAVGQIFTLDPATSSVAVAFLNSHFGSSYECTWSGIVVNSGLLRCISSTIFLPVYMGIVFSVLQKRIPKIFHRLGIGMFLYFLGGLSIFAVDTVGHSLHQSNDTHCILSSVYSYTSLNMHWAVNIPSNLLLGIGPTLVTVTVFEFISAQSPHSMKGLLLGTFYAIAGICKFFSAIALMPLTSHKLHSTWQYPARTGCLFGYLLYICLVALISVLLFTVTARKYRYRERDDRPYDHRFVINVYSRYITQAHNCNSYSINDSE